MADALTWRTVADRLDDAPRGSKLRLAEAMGMDPSFFYRKLKSAGDLSTTQASIYERFVDGPETPGIPRVMPAPAARRRIPFYGYAAASEGDRVALNPGQVIEWQDLPFELPETGEFFGVFVAGDSMEPRLFSGERLVVRRHASPVRDRDAVIEFKDGSGVVKLYRGQRDGRVFAEQLNPEKPLSYDGRTVEAIHSVYARL